MSRQSPFSPGRDGDAPDVAPAVAADRQALLATLSERRKLLGISQTSFAESLGLSRMSVARAERRDADLQLSTFLGMARGLGLSVKLKPAPTGREKPPVHRGLAANRIASEELRRRNPLEARLAKSWAAANDHSPQLPAVMHDLVPGFSQRDAEVAATLVQWLGSEVGFAFLSQALAEEGYLISRPKAKP